MYKIQIRVSLKKIAKQLPVKAYQAIVEAIYELQNNPRPQGYIKLKNKEEYRIRVGNYRVLYEIHDDIITIIVIDIGHRKDIYK